MPIDMCSRELTNWDLLWAALSTKIDQETLTYILSVTKIFGIPFLLSILWFLWRLIRPLYFMLSYHRLLSSMKFVHVLTASLVIFFVFTAIISTKDFLQRQVGNDLYQSYPDTKHLIHLDAADKDKNRRISISVGVRGQLRGSCEAVVYRTDNDILLEHYQLTGYDSWTLTVLIKYLLTEDELATTGKFPVPYAVCVLNLDFVQRSVLRVGEALHDIPKFSFCLPERELDILNDFRS